MTTMNNILKYLLYAGAVACGLAGLWVVYVAIANFREMKYPEWLVVLIMELIFVTLAFTPAFMFLRGLRTKKWHWVFTGVVEALVIAVALYAVLVLVALAMRGAG